jgi:hypothetical protein
VPVFVNCAAPSRWMSVQYCADASQKFTWPALIEPDAGVTAAVRVTTVPSATVVFDPPFVVNAKVVVVTTLLWAAEARLIEKKRRR